jgi:uncharacterized cupin superfamily protein
LILNIPTAGAMPKLNISAIPQRTGSGYPEPFHNICTGRIRQALGDAGGLTQFGVNLLQLAPGTASSQRHWHSDEDEFVFIVQGEVVLVTDQGEEILRAGDCAAFPRGAPNGHQLTNRGHAIAICLEVGTRIPGDSAVYPDIDLLFDGKTEAYTHRDGRPYPKR